MSIFVAKGHRKKSDGSRYEFYVLRETTWDKKAKAVKQGYLAYLGTKPVITGAKAQAIAKKVGVKVDDLRKVRGLKIKD